jgi:thioredoxin reductase (NADPH)
MEQYDVIVVGAGPAGWSAATFLVRAQIKTLVIGDMAHSGLSDAVDVLNYPGFTQAISGPALLNQMRDQALEQGAVFITGEVVHIERSRDGFVVKTADTKEFFAQRLLLAHGANFIKVHLPGEQELIGKGIHYCALCDGPTYKGRQVIVLGNGNYAAEEAIQLSGMGASVRIITHAISPNIAPVYQKLLDQQKIPVLIGKVQKFESGVRMVVQTKDGQGEERAEGVFVALGIASSAVFAKKLGLEMNGNFLKADENGRTNVAGVWVAGLARGGVNQIAKSVGEGAVSAIDIIKAATGLPQYLDHT